EPPKASAEPAPPATAAKPDAAPKTAPENPSDVAAPKATTAPSGVVQMENSAGSGPPSSEPAITGTSAGASAPSVEPGTPGALAETTRGGPAAALKSDDWHFDFHGYLRAPMRVGLGHNDKPAAGQSSSSVHAPLVP